MPHSNHADDPGTSVSVLEIHPPVQLSAATSRWWWCRAASPTCSARLRSASSEASLLIRGLYRHRQGPRALFRRLVPHPESHAVHRRCAEKGVVGIHRVARLRRTDRLQRSVKAHLHVVLVEDVLAPQLDHPAAVRGTEPEPCVEYGEGILVLLVVQVGTGVVVRHVFGADVEPPDEVGTEARLVGR